MADDCVPASPITLKAKKRKGGLLQRKAKRRRGKDDKVSNEISKAANEINTTVDPGPEGCKDESINKIAVCNNLDINALYWPESDGKTSKELQDIDLFYEARVLEQANQIPAEVTSKIPAELVKGKLISVDALSQQIKPQPAPAKVTYESQFVTDSEMVRACEVVDAISALHRNIPKFSQWNSPCVSSPEQLKIIQSPEKMEVDSSGQKQNTSPKNCAESTPYVKGMSQKPGTSYARRKYGREIEKAARKRINFFDDSDSKSSLSSDLSLQSNEGIQFTPLDEVDLNKSFHVHENLHNLSSFFSQSFVQDDVDNTTNGVFRYIMLMKSKRKDAKMIHWFRSGKNFAVNETRSSKSLKGFSKSEKSTSNVDSSREDIRELLDEDEDFFKELTKEKNLCKHSLVAGDIDNILKDADRVLQEVSEFDTNIEDEINQILESKSTRKENNFGQGFNIDTLLHGKIIETPKMNRLSESSIADSSPWIMRPKVQNSITASDIEYDSEPKYKELDYDSSPSFDTTFIIPKTPKTMEKVSKTTSKISSVGERKTRRDSFHEEFLPDLRSGANSLQEGLKPQMNDPFTFKGDCRESFQREPQKSDIASLNNNYKSSFQFRQAMQISKKELEAAVKIMDEGSTLEMEKNISSKTPIYDSNLNAGSLTLTSKSLPKQYKINRTTQSGQRAENNCSMPANVGGLMTGFTTAGGKNLFVSSAGQMRALKITSEIENEDASFDRGANPKFEEKLKIQSTKHSPMDRSKISKKIFNDNPQPVTTIYSSNDIKRKDMFYPNSIDGLPKAKINARRDSFNKAGKNESGKAIFISEEAEKKAERIMQELNDLNIPNQQSLGKTNQTGAENNCNMPAGGLMTGFTTAGGKTLFVSSAGQMRALKITSEIENEDGSFDGSANPSFEEKMQSRSAEHSAMDRSKISKNILNYNPQLVTIHMCNDTESKDNPKHNSADGYPKANIDSIRDSFNELGKRENVKAVSISAEAEKKAERTMQEVDDLNNANQQRLGAKKTVILNKTSDICQRNSVINFKEQTNVPKQSIINRTNQSRVENNCNMSANVGNLMTGFTTAGGKNLFVSSAGQMRALKIKSEIENEDAPFDKVTKQNFKEKIKSRSSKHSAMDQSKIIKNILNDNFEPVTVHSSKDNPYHNSISELPKTKINARRDSFNEPIKSESSKTIFISAEAEKKAERIMQEVDDLNNANQQRLGTKKTAISNTSTINDIRQRNYVTNFKEETNLMKVNNMFFDQEKENNPLSKPAKLGPSSVGDNIEQGLTIRERPSPSCENQSAAVNVAHEKAQKIIAAVDESMIRHQSLSVIDVTDNLCAKSIAEERSSKKATPIQPHLLKMPFIGFQSASGKTITVSKKALAKAEKKMAEEDDDILSNLKLSQMNRNLQPQVVIKNENVELKNTAVKGNEPTVASPVYTKRVLRSNSIENKISKSPNTSSHTPTRAPKTCSISPLVTSKRVLRSNSTEAGPSTLAGSFTTPGRVQSPLALSPIIDSTTPQRSASDIAPVRSRLSLSSRRFKPPTNIAEKSATPVRPIPRHLQVPTPNLQEFFNSVDTSTPKNAGKIKSRHRFTLSQEVSASTAALLEDEADIVDNQTAIDNQTAVQKIEWELKTEEMLEDLKMSSISKRASDDVINQRKRKRDEQVNLIQNKNGFQGIVQGGDLFIKKTNRNRIQLRDLAKNKPSYMPISSENIINHKFPVSNEDIVIATEDGSFIVPDDQSCVGFEEIKNAFLSLSSVAPSLVPLNWIQYHYKMIFLKLDWLNTISLGVLNPRNICLQLKYRYDHELDRAHRSILRKILECDESPAKRMVLLVLAIYNTSFNTEIELSDRWYSVKTTIDSAMQSLVESGKVKVGTKLMIQSAELLNCEEGCDALAIPADVRLKIHTNSTRRAKWDTKLGLYKVQTPFLLNMKQIRMNGKMVTRLEVYILRTYPSLFLREGKENGNVSEFHSEKVEKQLRQQEDVSKLSTIEAIFSQAQKEVDKEDRDSSSKRVRSKKGVENISDPAELYELIRWEGDTSEIEAELSCVQRSLLANYQQQIYADRMQKVQKRVQTKLEKQSKPSKSRELFKVRVIDYRDPNETAIISIWNPDPEIKNLLQEHSALEITHLIPKDIHSYELQLTSTKLTQYKVLPGARNQRANQNQQRRPIPEHYFRHVSSIQEIYSPNFKPAFNEFDTCGLIVMIGDGDDGMQGNQGKRFQPVYMSDLEENILCLNFWIGMKDYGYEDVIQIHRFVAASNLQWRSNSASGHIRAAFVTSTTTFTENPRNHDVLHALDALKRQFHSKCGDSTCEFIQRCRERIKEIKSRPNALSSFNASRNTNNSTMNSLASTSMNASTSLNNSSTINRKVSVQERIENMKKYGEPPDLSPIRMKCTRRVRKSFKVPTRVNDDSVS